MKDTNSNWERRATFGKARLQAVNFCEPRSTRTPSTQANSGASLALAVVKTQGQLTGCRALPDGFSLCIGIGFRTLPTSISPRLGEPLRREKPGAYSMKAKYHSCSWRSRLGVRAIARALLLVGAVLVYSPAMFGQGRTGAIIGTVSDSSGAVVPKAKVTLTNTANGATRVAVTNEAGLYVFPGVIPGVYDLVTNAEGFTPRRSKG